MHQEIIIAGMGGQGVMVMGQLLAHAALIENLNVVWFPAYGPETRGGTADCTVIISDTEIGSPVSSSPDCLIGMNQLLLDKFSPIVKPGGYIFVNTSLAKSPVNRPDCTIIEIAANETASETGNMKAANMVMLGAFVEITHPVKLESIKESMSQVLPERHHQFIPLNNQALDMGAKLVIENVVV